METDVTKKYDEYQKIFQAIFGLKAVFYINEVTKNGDIKLIWANKGIENILGYTVEERQEMGQDFYRTHYHPDDYDNVMKIIYSGIKGVDEYAINRAVIYRK